MKFSILLTILAVLALEITLSTCQEVAQTRVDPATSSVIVSAMVPVVTNLLSGLLGSLGSNNYQDTVIYGRPMRFQECSKVDGKFCMQLTDRGSSHTHVGTGSTPQEAIGDCAKKMFDDLLTHDIIDLWDLCHLHVTFPHPDQQTCPGAVVNPCHLVYPIKTTKKQCVNKLGEKYCSQSKRKGHCDNYLLQSHMMRDCFKACTDGTCQVGPVGPVDPCNTKPDHHNSYY